METSSLISLQKNVTPSPPAQTSFVHPPTHNQRRRHTSTSRLKIKFSTIIQHLNGFYRECKYYYLTNVIVVSGNSRNRIGKRLIGRGDATAGRPPRARGELLLSDHSSSPPGFMGRYSYIWAQNKDDKHYINLTTGSEPSWGVCVSNGIRVLFDVIYFVILFEQDNRWRSNEWVTANSINELRNARYNITRYDGRYLSHEGRFLAAKKLVTRFGR